MKLATEDSSCFLHAVLSSMNERAWGRGECGLCRVVQLPLAGLCRQFPNEAKDIRESQLHCACCLEGRHYWQAWWKLWLSALNAFTAGMLAVQLLRRGKGERMSGLMLCCCFLLPGEMVKHKSLAVNMPKKGLIFCFLVNLFIFMPYCLFQYNKKNDDPHVILAVIVRKIGVLRSYSCLNEIWFLLHQCTLW